MVQVFYPYNCTIQTILYGYGAQPYIILIMQHLRKVNDCYVEYLMTEDSDFELGIKLLVLVNCASKMITKPANTCTPHDPSIAADCPSSFQHGCTT